MFDINLGPEQLKNEVKTRKIYSLAIKISFLFSAVALFLGIVFFLSQKYAQDILKIAGEKNAALYSRDDAYSVKMKEINQQLSYLEDIQGKFVKWSKLLEIISGNRPDGISFSYVRIDRNSEKIFIRGAAKTRENLIDFKNKMDALDVMEKINFPLKSMLEKNDIAFNIETKIFPGKLSGN